MTLPLVKIQNLSVKRGRKQVLAVDTLTLDRGDVLAVVGPNGAGKSTLLLVLARLINPTEGSIRLEGQEIISDLAYRRRIALVLQDPLLFDRSVFDNVASGLRFRGWPKKEIDRTVHLWLERLGILELKNRRATELSGGEAQRVSLARAFVLKPELLLLDEPFSALDPPTRRRLVEQLSALLEDTGTTTVLVTHDLAEAARLGKRMAIIWDGRLRQIATHEPEIAAFMRQ